MRSLVKWLRGNFFESSTSRFGYKIQRLWLTPGFRRFCRVWMPMALVLGLIGIYFSDQERLDAINSSMAEVRRSIEERPEFMVKAVKLEGVSEWQRSNIRDALALDLPQSSFDLELDALKERVETLDAVRTADLRIEAGGLLRVNVVERQPSVVWRGPDGLELLDKNGRRVSEVQFRSERSDLPLLAGQGADQAVDEALKLLKRSASISDKIVGLVRRNEARWDIVLDKNQRILLPAEGVFAALDKALLMHSTKGLLELDVTQIDLRNPKRPTVRLGQTALKAGQAAYEAANSLDTENEL